MCEHSQEHYWWGATKSDVRLSNSSSEVRTEVITPSAAILYRFLLKSFAHSSPLLHLPMAP